MIEPELQVVLGFLASLVDLCTATSGSKINEAIAALDKLVKKFGLFGAIEHVEIPRVQAARGGATQHL
eukprot:12920025-Prorocentrum_lima.AAC.1